MIMSGKAGRVMTNQQLYEAVENDSEISREVVEVLLEMDATASVATQTEVNNLLVKIFKRMQDEGITVETPDGVLKGSVKFKEYVNEKMDNYTVDRFNEEIQ